MVETGAASGRALDKRFERVDAVADAVGSEGVIVDADKSANRFPALESMPQGVRGGRARPQVSPRP